MKQLEFSWDTEKDKSNQKKHGVSFQEAQVIRIISARKAIKKEQKQYEEHLS